MATSIIEWNECAQPERPVQGELVLTVDIDGDIGIMFWRDDAQMWDDPCCGWANGIVAWARLPLYVPTTGAVGAVDGL